MQLSSHVICDSICNNIFPQRRIAIEIKFIDANNSDLYFVITNNWDTKHANFLVYSSSSKCPLTDENAKWVDRQKVLLHMITRER